ncbi:FadR/GntR family transcriptional regulator [Leucobacter sp. Z1108]|uniref:FadR/GntR family transcriptional regulator n=1 Tax=Leucobacter sp. Z1108 TaxID=3439066 RepID=UPI003F3A5041
MEQPRDLRKAALLMPLAAGVRSDTVVERLSAAVRLGLMVDGEQLPNETDLAGQLNVSTVTLREALGRLRQRGIIETRRGRNGGSFVRFVDDQSPADLLQRLRERSSAEWRDFGEEHIAIGGRIAWLAARRATPSEVERLRNLAAELDGSVSRAQRQRADSRFHVALAVAAQSERLLQIEVRLQAESTELVWFCGEEQLEVSSVRAAHLALVDAVANEDEALARKLAEEHVQFNTRLIAGRASAEVESTSATNMFAPKEVS